MHPGLHCPIPMLSFPCKKYNTNTPEIVFSLAVDPSLYVTITSRVRCFSLYNWGKGVISSVLPHDITFPHAGLNHEEIQHQK